MPNDPGLSADTCIFMESVAGDGGVHNATVWWLSPDIVLNGPVSGPDKADPGQINPVEVRFHRKSAESQCSFPGDESLKVELWVGNPSLAMAPNNLASTALVQLMASPVPVEGASGSQLFNWIPPAGVPPSDPQAPGHKCLIARSYPDSLIASPTNFFVPDDPHVAQRNICIVPCDAPGAARRPGPCGLNVSTANLDQKEAQKVTLKVVQDLHPNDFVRKTVLESLRRFPGFKSLATRPASRFAFELREFPDVEIDDRTRLGCLGILAGGKRSYAATLSLPAAHVTNFNFSADLSGASFGEAHIFHLTQTGPDHRVQGGLTVVLIS